VDHFEVGMARAPENVHNNTKSDGEAKGYYSKPKRNPPNTLANQNKKKKKKNLLETKTYIPSLPHPI